jgi:hypothetical protein
MKKIIVVLAIVGSLVPILKADEKGAMLYSMDKRDLSLTLSEHISNRAEGLILKRVIYREVLVKGDDNKEITHSLFEVQRRLDPSQAVLAQNTLAD